MRVALFFLAIVVATLCLGGVPHIPRPWSPGEVVHQTIYAPFDFTVEEKGAPSEVRKGELIVSRGQRLTAEQVVRLSALDESFARQAHLSHWLGALLLSLLFFAVSCIYLKRSEPRLWKNSPQVFLILLSVALHLCASRAVISSPIDSTWIPTASIAMVLSMLFSPRLGVALGLITALLTGMMAESDLGWVAAASVGCFVGAYGMRGVRKRMHFFRVGAVTGSAQGLTLFAGELLLGIPVSAALGKSVTAVGSGILSALVTFCLLPLAEFCFGLITDVSLVELSDLNHPLLKELSVKAPGTYHHSLIVANLAEAAAQAVGANPLLARVGCYFHDIGKMLHPEYFVENQPPKHSRHERLNASLSSLVILNHVKDGVELARRYRLNQAIVDFIPGHHGTGLIYYFYRRALEETEEEALPKEERFRYPGPKPQTKETAIALLADSAEASTRALKEKDSARIEESVHRIINNKFVDGQLDECDVTLRDLDRIAQSFIRVLSGMYHQRIEYPQVPGEESQGALHVG